MTKTRWVTVLGFNKGMDREATELCKAAGIRPSAACEVVRDGGRRWLAISPAALAILGPGEQAQLIEWSDFAHAAWEDSQRLLTLTFIDPALPQMRFELVENYSENFVTAVRERIDRSVVYQQFVELTSGVIARGQVRRNSDETLFTQILVDGEIHDKDRDEELLRELETELREAVGL
ncbi:hypothetical protein JOD55_001392 [Arcanobacterium pluranimalium]|uniref:hypothetical protein n=1 Tax=Arcanobacterium pluranimalium TaxID=108028 RepID=UPI001959B505|nr:hypothetical protein [Arcanobacterium pluranimalium]MBM7825565.1 hypothetical protein [Arcanobacterium pluranimalium]